MGFEPTAEQNTAISARGSLLVSAAAGSGKTAVLSKRVVARILDPDDPIDISDMLIVTFTNAAAAEMRQRIAKELSDYLAEHGDSLRAVRQKADLDSAAIGTMDSFCQELVREHFEEAGVRPDFRIASAEQLRFLETRVATQTLEHWLMSKPDETKSMLLSLWNRSDLDGGVQGIIKLAAYTQALPFPMAWLEQVERTYDLQIPMEDRLWTKALLAGTAKKAESYLQSMVETRRKIEQYEDVDACYGAPFDCEIRNLDALCEAVKTGSFDRITAALEAREVKSARGAKKLPLSWTNTAGSLLESARLFQKKEKQKYRDWLDFYRDEPTRPAEAIQTFCRITRDYLQNLNQAKYEKNSYDFSDLEHAALRLLCDCVDGKPCVRDSELNKRYREVMVDEYQDTNDLQDAIFYALSDEGRHLFLVGDVKQSIYRFRRANPTNFIQKKESYPLFDGSQSPSKVILSGNFRSRPSICDFVNFTFRLLMTKNTAQMNYLREDELRPENKTFAPLSSSGVEMHIVESEEKGAEADYVARLLRERMDAGWYVSDGNQSTRKATWNDVVILRRCGKQKIEEYRRALEKQGIPSWVKETDGFFDRKEIQMAFSLLHAIDNPLRDVSLLATMMSPMFGFTADEMAQIRLPMPRGSLYGAVKADAKHNEKSAAFLNRLQRYRQWAGTFSSDVLIRRVMDDIGMTAIATAMEDGINCRANLQVLAEHAANYERNGFRGLSAYLRYVDRSQAYGQGATCACVQDGTEAVRIMTVHHAKGLQAPIVVFVGTGDRFNKDTDSEAVFCDEDLGVGTHFYNWTTRRMYSTPQSRMIVEAGNAASVAEEMRLLYVALTRAQDQLLMVAQVANCQKTLEKASKLLTASEDDRCRVDEIGVSAAGGFSTWLLAVAMLHPDGKSLCDLADSPVRPIPTQEHLRVVLAEPVEITQATKPQVEPCAKDFSAYLDYRYPYEDVLRFEAKYSVSQLAKSTFDPVRCCQSRPAFVAGETLTAAEKGTATHRFMCFADYERAVVNVADEIARLVSIGKLTQIQGKSIDVATVEAFFDSDIFARIQKADRVLRESRFLYEMPLKELDSACASDETVVVQGVADCVLFEPDGITILDFKTDRNTTVEELLAKYTRQLAVYSDAFSVNYRLPKKTPYLYSFSLRKTIPVPIEEKNKKI